MERKPARELVRCGRCRAVRGGGARCAAARHAVGPSLAFPTPPGPHTPPRPLSLLPVGPSCRTTETTLYSVLSVAALRRHWRC